MTVLSTLKVDADYGYVVLAASASFFLNFWQMARIGMLRKKHGIKYPVMYSDDHPQFNCAQRAHQNTLEGVPFFLATMLLGGLRHPRLAAAFGGVWLFGRIIYTVGYSTGNPDNRRPGFIISTLGGNLPLVGLAICTGAGMLGWW